MIHGDGRGKYLRGQSNNSFSLSERNRVPNSIMFVRYNFQQMKSRFMSVVVSADQAILEKKLSFLWVIYYRSKQVVTPNILTSFDH